VTPGVLQGMFRTSFSGRWRLNPWRGRWTRRSTVSELKTWGLKSQSEARCLGSAHTHAEAWTDTVYWIALPTCENTLPAFDPISLTVLTTMTRITASITEYSATSCPSSFDQSLLNEY